MKLKIEHKTIYSYDNEVILNPHTLYLTPQCRTYYTLKDYQLLVNPIPVSISSLIDLENNAYMQCWFTGYTQHLEISISTVIESKAFNPLNFIYHNSFRKTEKSFQYGDVNNTLLKTYLITHSYPELLDYTYSVFLSVNDIVTFLSKLNEGIYHNWHHVIRLEDGFLSPSVTFSTKSGSCRDLATMMIEMLRSVGLAARYVSGYAYNPALEEEHNLHSWAEVYIPGAGWIGLDPSLGLFTDCNYFPLVASYDPSQTLPVSGTYGGSSQSSLFTFVDIAPVSL